MATFSNSVLINSPGVLSLTPGVPVSFVVFWGQNISPLRWSRIWAGVMSPGDGDVEQGVTLLSEGSGWYLSEPGRTVIEATVRGRATQGGPVQTRLQVLVSQVDTF